MYFFNPYSLLLRREMLPESGWARSLRNMPQCDHLSNTTDRVRESSTTGPGRHGDDLQDCGTWGPRSGKKCHCATVHVQRIQRDLCSNQDSTCLPTSCCHEWPCPRTSDHGLSSHIFLPRQHPTSESPICRLLILDHNSEALGDAYFLEHKEFRRTGYLRRRQNSQAVNLTCICSWNVSELRLTISF